MSDLMVFPDTWEEFEKTYGFNDTEEIYTNGSRLIPSFRVKQWLDHLPSAQPEKMRGRWQEITESDCSGYDPVLAGYDDPVVGYVCSACHEGYEKEVMGDVAWNYCPNCGAKMER